jgi:hypothetical protein
MIKYHLVFVKLTIYVDFGIVEIVSLVAVNTQYKRDMRS